MVEVGVVVAETRRIVDGGGGLGTGFLLLLAEEGEAMLCSGWLSDEDFAVVEVVFGTGTEV